MNLTTNLTKFPTKNYIHLITQNIILGALKEKDTGNKKKSAKAVFLLRDIRIYGTKSAQNPGKHGPGPFAMLFFSKILAKYFLRYRDFGDFLVLDYNMGPQHNILRDMSRVFAKCLLLGSFSPVQLNAKSGHGKCILVRQKVRVGCLVCEKK